MAALSVHGLEKAYGGLRVTRGVSLEVEVGEIHALIGPNGAGKTSLVNQISGTVATDAGRILLAGRDVTGLPFRRRVRLGLARTFQTTALVGDLTALDNVALAVQGRVAGSLSLRPGRGDEALRGPALAALDEVGLARRAGVAAGRLSHGERRALEIAAALATQPQVLLLDEPLAGAGAEETERLIGLLLTLRKRFAILLVEHDTRAVFALADTVTVLVEGSVVAQGAPQEIRASAAVRAAYLGEDEAA
jgi:branched-chain amino acid transport system ATP-binding protein